MSEWQGTKERTAQAFRQEPLWDLLGGTAWEGISCRSACAYNAFRWVGFVFGADGEGTRAGGYPSGGNEPRHHCRA